MSEPDSSSFPRRSAATRRFTLGAPRNVVVSPDGTRATYLRSAAGDDPTNSLWAVDLGSGEGRLVADAPALMAEADGGGVALSDAERARRERARETADGITSYATDAAGKVAAFVVGERLYVAGLLTGNARELRVEGPVFDPRPDPTARRLAYVSGTTLRIGELDGSSRVLVGEREPDGVSWGRAEFIAAEELGRFRGYWWSPDGDRLLVTRVDERPVDEWTIADPARPESPARTVRYPAAGTRNAAVGLHLVDLDGRDVAVEWDHDFFPYVHRVEWNEHGLLFGALSRDQRASIVCDVDVETGETTILASDYDDAWIEAVPGAPTRVGPSGRLVTTSDADGMRRLLVDGEPVTPTSLQVRSVIGAVAPADSPGDGDGGAAVGVVVLANDLDEPTELHVHVVTLPDGDVRRLTTEPGVHGAVVGGPTAIVSRVSLGSPGTAYSVVRPLEPSPDTPDDATSVLPSTVETPRLSPNVEILSLGERGIRTALILPHDHDGSRLPVLLDPYGGPHAQRVVASHNAFLTSQWFAEQGFAVVVADGRGTPGRGADWERSVKHDLAECVLQDQLDALAALGEQRDDLDLRRVGIRGWSFGGYLAALAVLDAPDRVHAAVAGAPVTEWRLYDTCYTERYLGDPTTVDGAAVYDANSLLQRAGRLERPLLLVHGLADDNVVAAHTLQLSSALLAAGRDHEVLPLSGVTHMTPQEVVAENLLLHQVAFLRRALGMT